MKIGCYITYHEGSNGSIDILDDYDTLFIIMIKIMTSFSIIFH